MEVKNGQEERKVRVERMRNDKKRKINEEKGNVRKGK